MLVHAQGARTAFSLFCKTGFDLSLVAMKFNDIIYGGLSEGSADSEA